MTIKRDSIYLETVALTNSSAFIGGEVANAYKDEEFNWIAFDCNGKKWRMPIGILRNSELYDIQAQYSMADFIFKLYDMSADAQTVAYEFLKETVYAALEEVGYAKTFEDVCNYILTNLI